MNRLIQRSHLKQIPVAVLLLCFVQWAHGGSIICIGADGHVSFAHPEAKEWCKNTSNIVSPDVFFLAGFDHCVDIPASDRTYTPGIRSKVSRNKDAVAVRLENTPGSPGRSYSVWRSHTLPSPASLLLAILRTVVLLM
jgi:hypothetical protein